MIVERRRFVAIVHFLSLNPTTAASHDEREEQSLFAPRVCYVGKRECGWYPKKKREASIWFAREIVIRSLIALLPTTSTCSSTIACRTFKRQNDTLFAVDRLLSVFTLAMRDLVGVACKAVVGLAYLSSVSATAGHKKYDAASVDKPSKHSFTSSPREPPGLWRATKHPSGTMRNWDPTGKCVRLSLRRRWKKCEALTSMRLAEWLGSL